MKAHEPFLPWAQLTEELKLLEAAALVGDLAGIKTFLRRHVQGYQSGEVLSG